MGERGDRAERNMNICNLCVYQGDDYAAAFARLAIFATVARLQPVAADPALIIRSPSPRPPLHAACSPRANVAHAD